jgi:hypothetical protein
LDILLLDDGNENLLMRLIPDAEIESGAKYFTGVIRDSGLSGQFQDFPTQNPGSAYLVVLRLLNPRMVASAAIRVNPTITTTYTKSFAGGARPKE